ncbi:DUF4174 domain-containing protein [Pontibacter pamirensis]|uniref:DUF4174 domain-containing protein n=1 Tax=Pontibacter pamirensis TaxID=2562824 RepID=UPI00138A4C82|nr:DUF4174 domain-containing protein [Pontibacter pamirensis]
MKKILFSLFLAGFMLFGLRADAQTKSSGNILDQYKWKKRPLLLFAPSAENAAYVRQKELIENERAALADRDMVVVELIGQDEVYLNGTRQKGFHGKELRSRFQVPQEAFSVILIGKDGTEKQRNKETVALEKIFGLIDQMPMRRQEMRGENN